MPKTTQKNITKKEMEQVFALWKRKAKSGLKYFTGACDIGEHKGMVIAFYNQDKKNPKEPDLRIYEQVKKDGKYERGEEICGLWVNVAKESKKKYLTGTLDGQRVVGFMYEGDNEKAPYISVYLSDEDETKKGKKADKEETKQEEIDLDELSQDDDLPF